MADKTETQDIKEEIIEEDADGTEAHETIESETPDIEVLDEPAPDDMQKRCDELTDKLTRTLADFENFRKRTAKEKQSMYGDGVRDTLEKLLPTIDNFERAMAAAPNKADSFYKGIEMIYRQLMVTLDEMGVDVLPSVGEPFDLNIHHAVAHVDDEAYGENIVIQELQKGYKYKDKVIRHSMVKVAN